MITRCVFHVMCTGADSDPPPPSRTEEPATTHPSFHRSLSFFNAEHSKGNVTKSDSPGWNLAPVDHRRVSENGLHQISTLLRLSIIFMHLSIIEVVEKPILLTV